LLETAELLIDIHDALSFCGGCSLGTKAFEKLRKVSRNVIWPKSGVELSRIQPKEVTACKVVWERQTMYTPNECSRLGKRRLKGVILLMV